MYILILVGSLMFLLFITQCAGNLKSRLFVDASCDLLFQHAIRDYASEVLILVDSLQLSAIDVHIGCRYCGTIG